MSLFLEGCGTALVTPFSGGEVDYDSYIKCVDRQVAEGIDFLVALATTGETPALSKEEKLKLLKITIEHSGGKPVVAGCGANSIAGTLENMALLEDCGHDAWLLVVPFYNKPTQEGIYEYFSYLAGQTDKPLVIYNVPGRTGSNIESQTTLRLAWDCPNIIGIKEASGKYSQVNDIIRQCPPTFSVLSGDDDMTLAYMATGADGVISVASNLAPAQMSEMTRALLDGDLEAARKLHYRLSPLFHNCFIESNPIPIKAAMAELGLMSSEVRLPLSRACGQTVEIMKETIAKLW